MKTRIRTLTVIMSMVLCMLAITPNKITYAKKKNTTYFVCIDQPNDKNRAMKIIGTKYLRLNVKCKKATSEKKALHLKNNNYRLKNKKF